MNDVSAIRETTGGTLINVAVVPRSGRAGIVGLVGDVLKVRVKAAPVDGRANEELLALLAERLNVPRVSVHIQSGHGGRRKVVRVTGLAAADVAARLLAA
jgi:uncharacterized protein